MDGLIIREAVESDFASICKVRNTPDQISKYMHKAKQNAVRFVVCEQDEQVLGFVVLKIAAEVEQQFIPKVSDLYVASIIRSRGIGTALLRHLEHLAAEAGHQTLYLSVDAENVRAMALYQRQGYSFIQQKPYSKLGATFDEAGNKTMREYWRYDMVKKLTR